MTFAFGPFSFDTSTARLTREGRPVKLQPKSAALLAGLLEHPGAVVSRAEIQRRLWPEGTFVDFEIGIRVAVAKLRDALGDSAEEPVYVQTIPGEGYRFIAEVSATAAPPRPAGRRRGTWAGAAMAASLAAAGVWLLHVSRSNPPAASRDWVIIAGFENRTGEPGLDGALEYALDRELSRSRRVSVTPRDRIEDVLSLMRQPPQAALDERLARAVAVRDGGVKAVLSGRVEKIGGKYVATVRLVAPETGAATAVFEAVGSQEELLAGMRSISGQARKALGETGTAPPTDDPQVYRVTTASLPALRLFSAGVARLNNGYQWEAGSTLFEEAVRVDPDFATAHIYAARCLSNLKQEDRAAPHYEEAHRLAAGVSERERLFILGSYYERYLQDDRQALPPYQTLASLYPDHLWGVTCLLDVYTRLRMIDAQAREIKRLIGLRPARLNWLHTIWAYHTFLRPDRKEAKRYGDDLRTMEADRPDLAAGPDLDAATERWRSGDARGAARDIDRLTEVALKRGGPRYQRAVVEAQLALGRLRAAEEMCRMGAMSIEQPGAPSRDCLTRLAHMRDDRQQGMELLRSSTEKATKFGWFTNIFLSAVWLKEGSITERLAPMLPASPMTEGLLLLARDQSREAAERLGQVEYVYDAPVRQSAGTPGTVLWYRLGLASALEREERLEEAIAALEPHTRPGAAHLSDAWPWPQAREKVAELYRKAGRIADAARVEEELRQRLAAADADFPQRLRLDRHRAAAGR